METFHGKKPRAFRTGCVGASVGRYMVAAYKKYRNTILPVLILSLVWNISFCQTDTIRYINETIVSDKDSIAQDSVQIDNDYWQPNPKKALWFSLALPGLGQMYNRSWWKVPIIYGGLGVSIWFIGENHRNYQDFRIAYSESFDPDTDNELVLKYPNQESLRRIRDIYYKRYQLSIIVTAAIYLMNGLEAYVDAHLKNFEISDDLSFQYGDMKDIPGILVDIPVSAYSIPLISITYRID